MSEAVPIIETELLKTWIGRTQVQSDIATASSMARLAALLDHEVPPWRSGQVPPLGHWLYFLPEARQSELDVDGHPRKGGFLPPVPLPRRMWAGGALQFHAPIAANAPIERLSKIVDVMHKHGATGDLVFVTVYHRISSLDKLCVTERQDLVYRGAATTTKQDPPRSSRACDASRRVTPDPTQLFRFSALTFNSHRIHYDRRYALEAEGYNGLVVHGPFIATLLMDLLLRERPDTQLETFNFRAQRPLLDTAAFTVRLAMQRNAAELWSCDAEERETMTAQAQWQ